MALQVSFRVVGIYCYFENLQLPTVTKDSTVKQVMDAIVAQNLNFGYTSIQMGGKPIVNSMSYLYSNQSEKPFNATDPTPGQRSLQMPMDASLVWQYYRSVTGTINGSVCEIKLLAQNQPSFADLPLDYNDPFFGTLPAGFEVQTYNLTWRLVRIQMSASKQAAYMAAHVDALRAL
jgi:hypothetical protein